MNTLLAEELLGVPAATMEEARWAVATEMAEVAMAGLERTVVATVAVVLAETKAATMAVWAVTAVVAALEGITAAVAVKAAAEG
tara:strand:- start:14 stop:265 length:252 start_codon:yes stop_codon:yes gene_type:complete